VDPYSDAFVFFGATGDLAYKKIFLALQAMIRRGLFDMPVIGVARHDWTSDQLRDRARKSLEEHGGVDPDAFTKLSARLQYVSSDYRDEEAYARLRKALGMLRSLCITSRSHQSSSRPSPSQRCYPGRSVAFCPHGWCRSGMAHCKPDSGKPDSSL
jgi:glucose-6-phosphate 1-dehydrogenase